MSKRIGVYIGRFQPFHNGHLKVVKKGLEITDRLVILLGSCQSLATPKNPWGRRAREIMIDGSLSFEEASRVSTAGLVDCPDDDAKWVAQVKEKTIEAAKAAFPTETDFEFVLMGCNKGADTYYLDLFPEWKSELIEQSEALNATDIRQAYFSRPVGLEWTTKVPPATLAFLGAYALYNSIEYRRISEQMKG